MRYDDIRFSWWDDPDDEDNEEMFIDDDDSDSENDATYYRIIKADHDNYDDEPFTQECKMCGKERTLNEEGYCSQCWLIWNS